MQESSANNNRAGTIKNYRRTEAGLLQGKLFDAGTGEALVPMHTSKMGRRYRYYVSESLNVRGRAESASGWRLPGPVIEKTVYGIIRTMLNDRDAIIDAIRATDIPAQHISNILIRAQKVSQQQDQALNVFAHRITLRSNGLKVTISLGPVLPPNIEEREVTIVHRVPMQMQRRGNEMRLVIKRAGVTSLSVDETMVKSIARPPYLAGKYALGEKI